MEFEEALCESAENNNLLQTTLPMQFKISFAEEMANKQSSSRQGNDLAWTTRPQIANLAPKVAINKDHLPLLDSLPCCSLLFTYYWILSHFTKVISGWWRQQKKKKCKPDLTGILFWLKTYQEVWQLCILSNQHSPFADPSSVGDDFHLLHRTIKRK